MRTRFAKLAALMMVIMLALTGCSLIEIDQEMEMAEAVATVNGVKVTKAQVMSDYAYMIAMYNAYGITINDTILESIKSDVLDMGVLREVIRQKADELALIDFDDEASFAEPDAEAAAYFEELITEHAAHVTTVGQSEEAARAKVIEHLAAEGTTLDLIKESYRIDFIIETVREYVASSVTVTEEEIKAAYDEKVAADEEQYASSTYLYETHRSYGYDIAWNPEGYRTVKHILFNLTEEQSASLTALEDEIAAIDAAVAAIDPAAAEAPAKSAEELNAEKAVLVQQLADLKAEILASFKEKTDSVYARLEAGETFDALMAELGEDPGMTSEPTMTEGYYVTAESSTWDVTFRDAAMAIEAVGSVSEPVLTNFGVHIIYYNSDVPAGAIPYETLHDAMSESLLTSKQETAFNAQCAEWVEAAAVKKFPKVLK